MIVTILFGALLIILVITTVYDDLRTGLIRNRRLLHGLAAGTAVYAFLIVLSAFRSQGGLLDRLLDGHQPGFGWWALSLLNSGIGLVVGILLWHFKVWAAGDAKLFALYCYLIPHGFYEKTQASVFPGVVLLINIFTVAFAYLLADGVVCGAAAVVNAVRAGDLRERLKAAVRGVPASVAGVLPLLLVFMAMFAGLRAIREVARESITPLLHLSEFTLFIILFVAFKPLSKLTRRRGGAIFFSLLSATAIAYLAWRHGTGSLVHLLQPAFFSVMLILFAKVYQKIGGVSKVVPIGQLKPGMILAPKTMAALKAIEAKERADASQGEWGGESEETKTQRVPRKLGLLTVDGLSSEQIRYIKTRFNDDDKILVLQTIPFSPILAIGAVATFLSGSLLIRLFSGPL